MNTIERLVKLASPPISESTPRLDTECSLLAGSGESELLKLLWTRNGFYAFESALHVFPAASIPELGSISWWNSHSLWRSSYGELASKLLFFAEDIFGGQFCFSNGSVFRFDPETGSKSKIGTSIDEWADRVLENSEEETGWRLAHEWQNQFGSLAKGHRLIPKTPFVLGGQYGIDNLRAVDSVTGMNFYGNLATQIVTLPDGASVRLEIID